LFCRFPTEFEGNLQLLILGQLLNRGTIVNSFEVATPSLTEIFLKMVGDNDE